MCPATSPKIRKENQSFKRSLLLNTYSYFRIQTRQNLRQIQFLIGFGQLQNKKICCAQQRDACKHNLFNDLLNSSAMTKKHTTFNILVSTTLYTFYLLILTFIHTIYRYLINALLGIFVCISPVDQHYFPDIDQTISISPTGPPTVF